MQPRLHDAVIAEGYLDFGVSPDEAAHADADRVTTAATADIGAVPDHHAGGDLAFDDRAAERACVVINETFWHHSGSGRQVSAELYAGTVGDSHTRRIT